jgi:hypothetical protein
MKNLAVGEALLMAVESGAAPAGKPGSSSVPPLLEHRGSHRHSRRGRATLTNRYTLDFAGEEDKCDEPANEDWRLVLEYLIDNSAPPVGA